ncbi:hypothetical protein K5V21_13625 [Clostridium sardiniense]|uniref:DUF1778 domain-containing protein n=1 Tax=Clostridium sardiniense TaxID=29369 RepID=A0ABS7L0A0_CLOSR|nr:hypothetical protein [Clostridium sardiniense]MBY0756489.1 hypothetical protein [Clostridium sardiniense]MDQ0460230.1 uncharacterized protein (DUF1778 family) [Clostridium sardiniense]
MYGIKEKINSAIINKRNIDKIEISISKEEKEIIEKLAKLHKLNTKDFIRWVVLNKFLNDFIKIN